MKSTILPVELLTVADVAEKLHVSTKTVARMYRRGVIPHVRVGPNGRTVRIRAGDVDQYIRNHLHVEPL